jgi:hypothetical protein
MRANRFVPLALAIVTGAFAAPSGAAAQNRPITFNEDIAPIVFSKCSSCHRPGESAPFSLLSFDDVKRRGSLIATVTSTRRMPPWKADEGDYAFAHDRRLSEAQIGTFKQWVAAGMPEGPSNMRPQPPKFPEGWQLGTPDLVVKMSDAYKVPADGPDIYRNFAIPLNTTEDHWVRAVEFRPGARTVVHHSLFYADATGSARKQEADDPEPGFGSGMGGFAGGALRRRFGLGGAGTAGAGPGGGAAAASGVIADPSGGALGGWAVGAQARALPDGLAYFLPKGSDLVLSSHFHPSGKVEEEISTVGIYFAKAPPKQSFAGIQLPPLFGALTGLNIPAGSKDYSISDSFVLPVDVKAFGASAHAHYLAKQMHLTATLPSGETRKILWINDWDFAWQDQYQFDEFIALPKGTRLDVTVTYDNSADNPRNPSSPPKMVRWGEGSFDEMGSMSLLVVAAQESDLPTLQTTVQTHVRQAFMKRMSMGRVQ